MSNTRQVILIAGPAASGKSFLLNRIFQGLCPRLCTQLGVKNQRSRQKTSLRHLSKVQNENFDKLIIHCDLYNTGVLDRLEKVLHRADHVVTLTLCVSSAELVVRNKKRIQSNIHGLLNNPMEFRQRIGKISGLYRRQKRNKDTTSLVALYNNWFDLLTKDWVVTYWMDSTDLADDPVAQPYRNDRNEAFRVVRGAGPVECFYPQG
jgi:hypothetical protein